MRRCGAAWRGRRPVALEPHGDAVDERTVALDDAEAGDLLKAAVHGADPNWGRVIHAVGYSRARIREELIDIAYDGKPACRGGLVADTAINELQAIVDKERFTITINLHLGRADYTIYTSDISPEYIDFNRSEYAYWKNTRHA